MKIKSSKAAFSLLEILVLCFISGFILIVFARSLDIDFGSRNVFNPDNIVLCEQYMIDRKCVFISAAKNNFDFYEVSTE